VLRQLRRLRHRASTGSLCWGVVADFGLAGGFTLLILAVVVRDFGTWVAARPDLAPVITVFAMVQGTLAGVWRADQLLRFGGHIDVESLVE